MPKPYEEVITTNGYLLTENDIVDLGIVFDKLGKIVDKIKFHANFIDLSVGGMRCYANSFNQVIIGGMA